MHLSLWACGLKLEKFYFLLKWVWIWFDERVNLFRKKISNSNRTATQCLFVRNIIENNSREFYSYKCIHYLPVYNHSIKGMTQYPIISNLARRKCGIALPFAYFRHKRNKMSLSYITTIYSDTHDVRYIIINHFALISPS